MYGSCFYIYSVSLYLSVGTFNPFTFKIIIDIYVPIGILKSFWVCFCRSFLSIVFTGYVSPFSICCKAGLVVLNSLSLGPNPFRTHHIFLSSQAWGPLGLTVHETFLEKQSLQGLISVKTSVLMSVLHAVSELEKENYCASSVLCLQTLLTLDGVCVCFSPHTSQFSDCPGSYSSTQLQLCPSGVGIR